MIERSTLSRTQLRVREREWVRLTFPTKLLKLLLSLNISNLLLALSSTKQRLIPLLSSSIEAIVFFIVLWSYSGRSASSISGAWPRVSGPGFLCIISRIPIRMFWLLVGGQAGLVCTASRLRGWSDCTLPAIAISLPLPSRPLAEQSGDTSVSWPPAPGHWSL